MSDDAALPADRADLDGLLTWAVIRAARGFETMLADVLDPFALTPIQFGALAQLSVEPFLTQAQLAHRILMRPQSANHLLNVLIERGLVQRTGERGSGRPNPVQLTPAGRALLARAWPRVVTANEAGALGISAPQHEDLHRIVQRILQLQADAPRH